MRSGHLTPDRDDVFAVRCAPVPERVRLALYVLVILLLCSFTMFHRLGEGTLENDEARYGGIVYRISDHGDWLFLIEAEGSSYLNKPAAADPIRP
jgi:4-amino-4-deoxy-L-arabinose transferase-like glycosyltransferase